MNRSQVEEAINLLGIDTHGLVSIHLDFGVGTGEYGQVKTVHLDKTAPLARFARITRRELIQRDTK